MNNKSRLRAASLSFLGCLASVACSGQSDDGSGTTNPLTPTNGTATTNPTSATSSGPAIATSMGGTPSMGLPPAASTMNPVPAVSNSTAVPAMSSAPGPSMSSAPDPVASMNPLPSTEPTPSSSAPDPAASGTSPAPSSSMGMDTPVEGGYPENTGAACAVTAGELAMHEKLPDPFAMNDGTRITTKAEWECRRNEIKKDIEKYEVGTKPEPPTVEATLSGTTLNVVVSNDKGSITLSSTISGNSGNTPQCVIIGMNSNSSMVSGCVQVPFKHDQVVFEDQNASRKSGDPYYKLYPELWNAQSSIIGNYSAWSWGISRLIDGLDQVKDELNIDMTKIGVHGCSYAGKMALFAGAFDERIALTIAQESGGGGITSWRTSKEFTDRTGTNIEKIDNTNYSWFMQSMKTQNPYSLPHDHHELIAMIAPRAVIALGNQDYEWLGDESGFKSINAAKQVWKAMGIEDRIGYDFTSNHGHCQAPAAQQASVTAFVNKFLKGQDADTAIAIQPQEGNFDLDYTNAIDWETPTLQ